MVGSYRTVTTGFFLSRTIAVLGLGFALTLGGCGGNANKPKPIQAAQETANEPAQPLNTLRAWAESGDIGAQYDLGLTLAESDPAAAARWFESAALQGQGAAAYQLGLMQSDPNRAVEWYSMASAMGHIGAQYQLGEAYLNGRGTAKEPGWGLMWMERSARAGYGPAQLALGVAMASGVAGRGQRARALTWLLIADDNNIEGGAPVISALRARLSNTYIESAEQHAQSWRNEPFSDTTGDRASLRFAQYALSRLGYDPGTADGIDGERTYGAIADFRAAEGLGGGGCDGKLLDRLRERLTVLNR
jgi:hypothetical protein